MIWSSLDRTLWRVNIRLKKKQKEVLRQIWCIQILWLPDLIIPRSIRSYLGSEEQEFVSCSILYYLYMLNNLLNLPALSYLILLPFMLFSLLDSTIKIYTTLTVLHLTCLCIYLFIHQFLESCDDVLFLPMDTWK